MQYIEREISSIYIPLFSQFETDFLKQITSFYTLNAPLCCSKIKSSVQFLFKRRSRRIKERFRDFYSLLLLQTRAQRLGTKKELEKRRDRLGVLGVRSQAWYNPKAIKAPFKVMLTKTTYLSSLKWCLIE